MLQYYIYIYYTMKETTTDSLKSLHVQFYEWQLILRKFRQKNTYTLKYQIQYIFLSKKSRHLLDIVISITKHITNSLLQFPNGHRETYNDLNTALPTHRLREKFRVNDNASNSLFHSFYSSTIPYVYVRALFLPLRNVRLQKNVPKEKGRNLWSVAYDGDINERAASRGASYNARLTNDRRSRVTWILIR